MDYYDTLYFKTAGPFVVLVLLWSWPLIQAVRRKLVADAVQNVAKISLFWLELCYVSVSTTIAQCFVCGNIGGQLLLRAQLTLPCDDSERRRVNRFYAGCMVLLYPIGIPLLMFALMYPNRHGIRNLMEAAKKQDEANSRVTSLKRMTSSRRDIHKEHRKSSIQMILANILWLSKKFKNFRGDRWWMGIVVLVVRLCQTSLMVLCQKQIVQTSCASVITLASIVIQREAWPYRHNSE